MSKHENTREQIERKLLAAFSPTKLIVHDDSAAHKNHLAALAQPQAGHFQVEMVSVAFAGKSAVERHRMVYAQLNSLMDSLIHAISLNLKAPDEK